MAPTTSTRFARSAFFASDMPSLGAITGYFARLEEGKSGSENIFPEHIAFLSHDIPGIPNPGSSSLNSIPQCGQSVSSILTRPPQLEHLAMSLVFNLV